MVQELAIPTLSSGEPQTGNVLIVELLGQSASAFRYDEGNAEALADDVGNKEGRITSSTLRTIVTECLVKAVRPGKESEFPNVYTLKRIRYIKGCPFIDVEEQVKHNWQPNPVQDIIEIRHGRRIVFENGADEGLYLYLKNYAGNESNPNRPDGYPPIFREISTVIEQGGELPTPELTDALMDAMSFLSALKSGKTTSKAVQYNMPVVRFLNKLFALEKGANDGYDFIALVKKAQDNPEEFMKTVNAKTSETARKVAAALNGGVIETTVDGYRFQNEKDLLLAVASTDAETKRNALIEFMLDPENEQQYSKMVAKISE